jgi:AraC family transcriptional regulator, exoenzyme S synthesis regulatory protein ExsA
METLFLPDFLLNQLKKCETANDLLFFNYKASSESEKNKVIFKKNVFNFPISGKKIIHTFGKSHSIDNSQAILIKNGNCLTTEKYAENGLFNSLIIFFDSKCIEGFLIKFSKFISKFNQNSKYLDREVYIFERDELINNFINSIFQLIEINKTIPPELAQIKFEEILLYLIQKNSSSFMAFLNNILDNPQEIDFRTKIETEPLNKLTLDEMAFLCNMSLSAFKRHFVKSYGEPPQKWFDKKRLQFAYDLLKSNKKKASDLYLELGYSSLSSFSVAFSRMYGIPPTKVKQLA